MLLVQGRRFPRNVDGKLIALFHRSSARTERKGAKGQKRPPTKWGGAAINAAPATTKTPMYVIVPIETVLSRNSSVPDLLSRSMDGMIVKDKIINNLVLPVLLK